jgi:hypothetical protein
MLILAVLLAVAGLMGIFSWGVAGYVLGPLMMVAGGLLFQRELRRRKQFAAQSQPVPRRGGWQRFLIVASAIVVGFTAVFALAWRLTAVLADTADSFFLAMQAGDMARARTYLAEDFRASTSDEDLKRFVQNSALANYASASWTSRSIENSLGKLEGTVETRSGGAIPMTIAFVHEGGGWKILSLQKPDAGILADDARPQPDQAEQRRLAAETTQKFADASASQDFTPLYRYSSAVWQKQSSAQKLAETFKSFHDSGIDLHRLAGDPVVTAAKYDDDGAFAISGSYPYGSNTFTFRYRYVYETVSWKLVGIHANLQ